MDDELDALRVSDADLEQRTRTRRADEHRQVAGLEDPDRVAEGVQHVFIEDPVFRALARIAGSIPSSYLDTRSSASAPSGTSGRPAFLEQASVLYTSGCSKKGERPHRMPVRERVRLPARV